VGRTTLTAGSVQTASAVAHEPLREHAQAFRSGSPWRWPSFFKSAVALEGPVLIAIYSFTAVLAIAVMSR
jgi:hypothetical protein